MAIIYTYPRKSTAEAGDLVVISDSSDSNKTKQLTLQSIADYIDGEVTLQEVLNTGSRAVNDGNTWNGLFRLDDSNPVGSNPQFIVDMNASSGSGSSVVYIVGKLETALGSDASFGNDIAVANNATISGNLTVTGTSTFVGSLDLDDAATELKFQSDAGTSGYVAKSNGAGAAPSWVDPASLPAGNVEFEVNLTEAVAVGDPLHIISNTAGVINVEKAQASDVAKMPAAGIAKSAGGINDTISMIEVGTLEGNFLASGSTGDVLYVGPTGGLTTTRPTAVTDLVQNAGIITRQSGVNDRMQVTCIGRTNDTPNIISNTKRFEVTDDRGSNNVTFGLGSFSNAIAGAIQNVVVGRNAGTAISAEDNSVILGDAAGSGPAIGSGNVLIGANAGSSTTSTSATDNTMIGRDTGSNLTTGEDNVFIGPFANTNATNNAGSRNVIVGHSSTANGNNAVIVGYANNAASSTNLQGDKMVVIGSNISAQNGSSPVGSQTSVTIGAGDNNAAKALLNQAAGAVLIGNNTIDNKGITANSPDSIGIGTSVNIDAESGIAIGTTAEIQENSTNAIAIGNAAQIPADSEYAISIGSGSRGRGEQAVSIGNGASTQDGFSRQISIGTSARTQNGNDNIAIGNNAAATANLQGSALALMPNSVASAQYAMAIGTNTDATEENAIAIGTNGQATDYPQQINIRNTAGGNLRSIPAATGGLPAGVTRNGDVYIVEVDNALLGGPPGIVKLLAIV